MEAGIHIDFAWRTFIWNSEASQKAHVHCVIIGFSICRSEHRRIIYDGKEIVEATNINGYLIDGDNVFVENHSTPICHGVPEARSGNKPIDDGNYLFTDEEKDDFVRKEPISEKFFKRWYGSEEFINRCPRWCLWLGDADPVELIKLPECVKRIEAVRNFRLSSKSKGTIKLADRPTRFHVESMYSTPFLVMPLTSSERREYVPIGFLGPENLASNLVTIVPNCSSYHFGIITSSVFMAWMRVVCCRLKSDYRITKDNVYNNFPWPSITDEQMLKISRTAEGILAARELYPSVSFAQMYGKMILFPELQKAHRANDAAVLEAYGFPSDTTESDIVARLFKMYQELTS